ncbi:MAG: serine hydrolase family protein [Candidatus Diapherotrites archaeon]|nr:serine hydrolase family protein [Candidatus Diapherotrites archaeon]
MLSEKTLVLVHGWGGTHPLHWQNWLKEKATQSGYKAIFPLMPNYNFPVLSEWLATLEKNVSAPGQTILVGHSLGCPTILRYLEKLSSGKIPLVVLVSGFARPLGIAEIDGFVSESFDWEKIKQSAEKFAVVFSDSDPFIPMKESLYLSDSLGVKPVVEKNAGHITAPDFGPYERIWRIVSQEK